MPKKQSGKIRSSEKSLILFKKHNQNSNFRFDIGHLMNHPSPSPIEKLYESLWARYCISISGIKWPHIEFDDIFTDDLKEEVEGLV